MYKSYVIFSYAWVFYMDPAKPNQNQFEHIGLHRVQRKIHIFLKIRVSVRV